MKKIILAGSVPYLAVAAFAASAFYFGYETSKIVSKPNTPKIAFAEKGAVITESVLSRQDISDAVLNEQITKPILAVIKRYVDRGYLVIDSSRNENGSMTIIGVPPGATDITAEMKAAIKSPSSTKTTTQTTANASHN